MDLSTPPRTYAELELWKVFVATTESEVWQVIFRWVKKYGNPFEERTRTSFEEEEVRQLYQESLRITYVKK